MPNHEVQRAVVERDQVRLAGAGVVERTDGDVGAFADVDFGGVGQRQCRKRLRPGDRGCVVGDRKARVDRLRAAVEHVLHAAALVRQYFAALGSGRRCVQRKHTGDEHRRRGETPGETPKGDRRQTPSEHQKNLTKDRLSVWESLPAVRPTPSPRT